MALNCCIGRNKKILDTIESLVILRKLSKLKVIQLMPCKPKAYFQLLIIVNHSCLIITMSKMYLMAHVFGHDTQINVVE